MNNVATAYNASKLSSNATVSQRNTAVNTQRAALAYAEKLHWAVLPVHSIVNGRCSCNNPDCNSPGKHPRNQHGVNEGTKDPAIIKSWWNQWPNANIGVAAGKISGFFVVDIDGEIGEESLQELEAKHGALPETVEQLTGGGGRHLLFKYPDGANIRPKVAVKDKLDIRGEGSYIVVAPSVHVSGRQYCWEVSHHPLEMQIADAPDWLLELVVNPQSEIDTPQPNEWARMLDELIEGRRNSSLYRYACHLLAHGLSAVETVKLVRALNKAYGRPPLQDKEVDGLLKSAIEWRSEK